jgi:hypothetical protein
MLAYAGTPLGACENELMRTSVDLVIPDLAYFKHLRAIARGTPLLLYTNTSTLYLDLLADWLAFADRKGVSREGAFFHAAIPEPYQGNSPSSRPVAWFWSVLRGGGRTFTDLTAAAHGPNGPVRLGSVGDSLYLGYPERFREINVSLAAPGAGWHGVIESCNAIDTAGRPTGWEALRLLSDTTARLSRSGRMTFDPPPAWRPGSIYDSARLYFLRVRTTAGAAPVARAILGRDFVNARGTVSGVVPVFDASADRNGDGYLDDAEYAHRAPGNDARFAYESRLVVPWYGPMRFVTNPAHAAFHEWVAEHHRQLLAQQPLAAGLFMDNSGGKLYQKPTAVVEPIGGYASQYGQLMATVARAIAPRWVLLNTEGGGTDADQVIRYNPAYLEEFALQPLAMPWPAFEELLAQVERRSRLTTPPPLAVIDSRPDGGAADDPRTQLATLAAYYLLADPDSTCLMFFGGAETCTSWKRHWTQAAAYDVGRPAGRWRCLASGPDPAAAGLSYRVYARSYQKALVLYRPLSGAAAQRTRKGGLGAEGASQHELGATYRPLLASGTLGAPLNRITLRNGEGAVLVPVGP